MVQNCLFGIVVIMMYCSKGGDPADDGSGGSHVVTPSDIIPPVITIATPTANQVFSNGSNITISGRITDDLGLYRGTIKLVNDATGFSIVNQPYEIHGLLQYNYTLSQVITVQAATDFTVTVTFEDHGNNITSQTAKIRVNP